MINYQKIFFGLFLSLIFVFPKFVFAQITNDVQPGGYTNLGNCQNLTYSFITSKETCQAVPASLSTQCNVKATFLDTDNSCTVIAFNCKISCLSVFNYLKNLQAVSDSSNTSGNGNNGGAASVPLKNPLGTSTDSVQKVTGGIINSILGIIGSIALLMFIYGGFTWLTSGGSAENVKKGKEIIVWAVIGLAIVFLSYGLVTFLILNIK
jgi:hypothetical protein